MKKSINDAIPSEEKGEYTMEEIQVEDIKIHLRFAKSIQQLPKLNDIRESLVY